MSQVTSITFFKYKGFKQKWKALKNMGLLPKELRKVEGSIFTKLLGSGGGTGFGVAPNFGVYGLLHVWESKEKAELFFKSDLYQTLKNESSEQWTTFFKCYKKIGAWDKQMPFIIDEERDMNAPIVVITRASIKLWRTIPFWRRVPAISKFILTKDANIFSVGVGEIPWIYQVTFSIWKSEEEMIQFAHKDKHHGEAAKISLDKNWFKEYMFNRFYLVESRGTWEGKEMDDLI